MFTHNTSALSATHSVAEGFIRPSASGPNDSSWLPQQTVSKHVDNRLLDHILGKQTLSVCWRLPNIWWSWLISALDNHWQRAQSTQSFPGPSRRSNCGSCYSSILRHRPWIRQTMGFSFSFLHHSVFVTVFVRLCKYSQSWFSFGTDSANYCKFIHFNFSGSHFQPFQPFQLSRFSIWALKRLSFQSGMS
jgi:hypothetical protein